MSKLLRPIIRNLIYNTKYDNNKFLRSISKNTNDFAFYVYIEKTKKLDNSYSFWVKNNIAV